MAADVERHEPARPDACAVEQQYPDSNIIHRCNATKHGGVVHECTCGLVWAEKIESEEVLRDLIAKSVGRHILLRKSTSEVADGIMADAVKPLVAQLQSNPLLKMGDECFHADHRGQIGRLQEERDAARLISQGRTMEEYDSEELGRLRVGIVNAINAIRGWCAPGGPGLFSPAEATELMMVLRKTMGDQLIDALSAASRPDDGTDLAEGDALLEAAVSVTKRRRECGRALSTGEPCPDHPVSATVEAYLVLDADGGRAPYLATLDHGRASEAARNIKGVMAALPVAEDYREPDEPDDGNPLDNPAADERWTDNGGRVWDLNAEYGDCEGNRWHYAGGYGGDGYSPLEPLMSRHDWEAQDVPITAVLADKGPLIRIGSWPPYATHRPSGDTDA